jgi:SAM-dependent methyltransferase
VTTFDALHPRLADAIEAWGARVRANASQVDRFREEADPNDFYAPVAQMFRDDPNRTGEPTLEALRSLVGPSDVVLDIGAGGGRYALPLAMKVRRMIAVDPSRGMLDVMREDMDAHNIGNVEVVEGRWPAIAEERSIVGDVALISHLGYDIEHIGPFLEAMERAASRLCVAVLMEKPPPAPIDAMWPSIHGEPRARLPALPEFLALQLARDRLCEVRLVERVQWTYDSLDQLIGRARRLLWIRPDGEKDLRLRALVESTAVEVDGRFVLSPEPVRIGVVTWEPPAAR